MSEQMSRVNVPGGAGGIAGSEALSELERRRARLKKAVQDFEAIFVGMLIKQMRQSMAGSNPLFGSNAQAHYYQEMMDEAIARRLSQTGAFGLGRMLYQRMERLLGDASVADPRAVDTGA
ncbi:MAG: rod-binding protein [Chloroherpetonaceae bacterium]|nr:rod-binding protein [Chthonomonadaceae bacterium]MDW8207713.1 rod-binding protein [Chloroherpetonaceae bacterium]